MLHKTLAFLLATSTLAAPALAETTYPLHLKNCGVDLNFQKAPASV